MSSQKERFHAGYKLLRGSLASYGDEAAMRSLERKFEQLDESLWFNEIGYEIAEAELYQEYYDCLPVDA